MESKKVCAAVPIERYRALERLAEAIGLSPTGALNALAPRAELADVLAMEAMAEGGVGEAIERLVAESLCGRMVRLGVMSEEGAEALPHNPAFVFEHWRRYLDIIADQMMPRSVGMADMVNGLRADDPEIRFNAGMALARAVGAGLRKSDASAEDVEHGAGRDVSNLIGRAIAGDASAVDELERVLTTDSQDAATTPKESAPSTPSSEARALAGEYSPDELIEMIEREPDAEQRGELVEAFYLSCGLRFGDDARKDAGALVRLADRLAEGDGRACESAKAWLARNSLMIVD